MATVQPIADKKTVKKAGNFIKNNFDPAYHLLWQLGIETGYRITDLTELKYSDINTEKRLINIAENKGSRARKARARLKVLEDVKNELIGIEQASGDMMKIFTTKPRDIYALIPESARAEIDARIEKAMNDAPLKYRSARISEKTMNAIKAREAKFGAISDGNIFARASIKSNRARNSGGVITRQSCHRVFSQITGYIETLGQKIKVACHSMRKIFARHLYESSGKDIAKLMKRIGHSSPEMSLRYIGIAEEEEYADADNLFEYMAA